jgi:phosphopantothenoylcysteine decarboxylase/phosphopantothenate--cysteine ligase
LLKRKNGVIFNVFAEQPIFIIKCFIFVWGKIKMFEILNDKKILMGVTGGIAAYKSCELIRLFKKNGADVKVIMTQSATEFVQPLTFRTLSGHKVYYSMFEQEIDNEDVEHISLARWADCIVVAPATVNCIAKLANGMADDLLTTILIASTAPICLAPAMNNAMWSSPATQANIKTLKGRNIHLFGPAVGYQACGEIGEGRMLEPTEIVAEVSTLFYPPLLKGTKIVITAGPTIEPIDPVRHISNRSSGVMGYAVAEAAKALGATVILISGPTQLSAPFGITRVDVTTAIQMRDAVMKEIAGCDIFIAVAAVADYRVKDPSAGKIKKTEETIMLQMIRNPDILSEVASLDYPPITVGFAAETQRVVEYAKEKLERKNIDIIAANQVGENLGFDQAENSLTVLTKRGEEIPLVRKHKSILAKELMQIIVDYKNALSPSIEPKNEANMSTKANKFF